MNTKPRNGSFARFEAQLLVAQMEELEVGINLEGLKPSKLHSTSDWASTPLSTTMN